MLEKLRRFECDRLSLDELIELSAYGKLLAAEYTVNDIDKPEWLETRTRELRREIVSRNQDAIESKLRELKARREALTPNEEKRQRLDAEIAALEQKTATVNPATVNLAG